MGKIEVDQVVAQDELRAFREIVQLGQRRRQAVVRGGMDQGTARVRPKAREGPDAAVANTDFKVQREEIEREAAGLLGSRRVHPRYLLVMMADAGHFTPVPGGHVANRIWILGLAC